MRKSIFEQSGGTYTQVGNYLLLNLLITQEQKEIGIWGQHYRRYLKQNHRIKYYNLLTAGKLNEHLAKVDFQAKNYFQRLVKSLAEQECVTEKIKAEKPIEWVQKMNNIRNRTTEIVNNEVIFQIKEIPPTGDLTLSVGGIFSCI